MTHRGNNAQLKEQFGAFIDYAMGRPSRYQMLFALSPTNPEEENTMQRTCAPLIGTCCSLWNGSLQKVGIAQ